MEVATRSNRKDRVAGLGNCIESDAQLTPDAIKAWKATKQEGLALFEPKYEGSYDIFNLRPIKKEIIDYCANDVAHLPILWKVYSDKLTREWAAKVQEETAKRLSMSKAVSYNPNGKGRGFSPWARPAKPYRGDPGTKDLGTRQQSAADVSVANVAQREPENQPDANPARQSSVR